MIFTISSSRLICYRLNVVAVIVVGSDPKISAPLGPDPLFCLAEWTWTSSRANKGQIGLIPVFRIRMCFLRIRIRIQPNISIGIQILDPDPVSCAVHFSLYLLLLWCALQKKNFAEVYKNLNKLFKNVP
jgi:hypothetical protein